MDAEFDWNGFVLESLALEDTSPNQITLRVARRIAALGMNLLHVGRKNGVREGFNWGRSSHGVSQNVIWTISFEDSNSAEHVVNVVVTTTNYAKRNPYDRTPKTNGQPSHVIMANDETKTALGWKIEQVA